MTVIVYTEEWRDAPGYEGRYQVSSSGQVRSLLRGRVLRQTVDRKGHRRLSLYAADGTMRTIRVHILALEAFVGPRPPGAESCHYDDDKTNNHISNLRWGTRSDNALDRVRNGLHNMARKTHCPKNHPYDSENTGLQRRQDGGYGRYCKTCRREARKAKS